LDLEQFEVHIVEYQETTMKSRYIIGYVMLGDRHYDFNALAYESHAGPNVNANFEETAKGDLANMGLDPDSIEELTVNLQRKLMEGDLIMDFERQTGGGS
jgi:hypothetical protein